MQNCGAKVRISPLTAKRTRFFLPNTPAGSRRTLPAKREKVVKERAGKRNRECGSARSRQETASCLAEKTKKQTDNGKKEAGKSKFLPLTHAFCKADNTFVF